MFRLATLCRFAISAFHADQPLILLTPSHSRNKTTVPTALRRRVVPLIGTKASFARLCVGAPIRSRSPRNIRTPPPHLVHFRRGSARGFRDTK